MTPYWECRPNMDKTRIKKRALMGVNTSEIIHRGLILIERSLHIFLTGIH
jgi:hypothetical protein